MLLSGSGGAGPSRRPSLHATIPPSIFPEYSDSRAHGPPGPSRHVKLPGATTLGGGVIAKGEDGTRCIVAGKESLRVLQILDHGVTSNSSSSEQRTVVGRGGSRIFPSRNLWSGSGLKVDSVVTDAAWAHGSFSNKVLTSARNGELIMWDLQKGGPSKFERRIRDHARTIHQLACSKISTRYCFTASADGDLRIWDLGNLTRSIMRIHHPTSIRSIAVSPVSWQPLQVIVGLDNGSIYRWDVNMGQRGLLDRIPVAHTKAVMALEWTHPHYSTNSKGTTTGPTQTPSAWYGAVGAGLFDDIGGFGVVGGNTNLPQQPPEGDTRMGWLASGGLDRCVKVWELHNQTTPASHSRTPTYTLHTSFPVRRVMWRPGYECELAVVSNVEFSTNSGSLDPASPPESMSPNTGAVPLPSTNFVDIPRTPESHTPTSKGEMGDQIEIWDVRRGHIAKWAVRGSGVDGGVTDMTFGDSHTMWAQHYSGSFSQFDLRQMSKPLDAVTRQAATWDATGTLTFVGDKPRRWEVPYDDMTPERRQVILDRKGKVKALGDKPYTSTTQTVGMLAGTDLLEDIEVFARLAKGYIFEGYEREQICTHNADVALDAGKEEAAQAWLLLRSLLGDVRQPPSPTVDSLSPLPLVPPHLPHSNSAPAGVPTTGHKSNQTSISLLPRSISVDNAFHSRHSSESPASSSRQSPEKPSAPSSVAGYLSPQRITPVSSATSSPHRPPSILPPVPSSIYTRRPSNSGLPGLSPTTSIPQKRPRLYSSYSYANGKRPLHGAQSESPSDMSIRSGALKHVGDGALSDSDDELEEQGVVGGIDDDSDDENVFQESNQSDRGSIHGPGHHGEVSSTFRSSVSPYLYPRTSSSGSHGHLHLNPNPSPLSRVAVQQTWTDDEIDRDDGNSPSPASSESEDSDYERSDEFESLSTAGSKGRRGKMISRRSSRSSRHTGKTRSRSSTMASLAASQPILQTPKPTSLIIQTPKLTKQDSQSSIRTVTAVNSPFGEDTREGSGLYRDDTIRDLSGSYTFGRPGPVQAQSYLHHKRIRSAISAEFSIGDLRDRDSRPTSVDKVSGVVPQRRSTSVTKEQVDDIEQRVRDIGWEALRETLDVFADEGDVQMCTLLSLVAGEELKISRSRLVRFLESYIEILARLRLHSCAAYLRKFSSAEEVRNTTSLETTLYTSCGRCRKPILLPSAGTVLTTTPTNATSPNQKAKLTLDPKPPSKPAGNYAYCLGCKQSSTKCSICHLPVRAMLFKCTVCMHGGHQECYKMYYLRRPVVNLKSQQPVTPPQQANMAPSTPSLQARTIPRGRTLSKVDDASDDSVSASGKDGASEVSEPIGGGGVRSKDPMAILGRPCAAGCGHYCWATSDVS